MDPNALSGAARHFKDKKIAVTFNKDGNGINTLGRIYRAYSGPGKPLNIDPRDQIVVEAVCLTRDWGDDGNRTVKIGGLENLDDNTLWQFARDIEKISA